MDDKRFDELTKTLSARLGSRRYALRAAAVGLATSVGAFEALDFASAKKKKNDKHNNKNNNKKKEKKEKICHCDNNGNNCKTKKVSHKQAKKHLRNHPNDTKGKCDSCDDTDVECNYNRPSECCSNICCVDNSSSTSGVCSVSGGICCGQRNSGGYCPSSFPQCCGQNACCQTSDVCCGTPQQPIGYCCPAGQECCNSQSGCCVADAAAVNTTEASGAGRQFEPRGRAAR